MKRLGGLYKFMALLTFTHGQFRVRARFLGACFLFASSAAHCACTNWSHNVGAADQRAIYVGSIGGQPVRMMLHYDSSANSFDGAYGYAGQPDVLKLTGHLVEAGKEAFLAEYDQEGAKIAQFKLTFDPPMGAFETERHYRDRVARPSCSDLVGRWHSKGGKYLKVDLYRSGTIVPRFDNERKINESTAYKLRSAMISSDKKKFASLLAYPFYSENAMHVETEWKTSGEVVANYDKIVEFSGNEVAAAVPHFLETSVKTLFMNGSIFIRNGKVTRVCEQVCSNSAP